jgi:hypothetical protein
MAAILVFFTPAQAVLANPQYQSAKFLSVMTALEPFPRVTQAPWVFPAGLISIGIVYGLAYSGIREALGPSPWIRGLRFGVVSWALMAFWFEFYLPWNVMHEPAPLVLLQLALWLAVLLVVGTTIALVYERTARSNA